MRKKLKYNSDFMSREMDKALEQIEDKLSALYANAAFDINREFAKFTDEFKERDAILAQRVENGMMSEEEYIGWRQRHILQSERYKGTVDTITNTLVSTDQAAMALVNGAMPSVIAQSYDFTQALGWKAAEESGLTQGTFQIYNARSVQKIIKENPDLLKHVDVEEDRRWNMDKVNKEIASSIVKGDSIEKVADGLQRVTSMDRNAAVRNARTAMTAAENMGRAEAADDLKAQGIPMDEVWSATYDDRTRETHLELDGTYRDENGFFGVGIIKTPLRFPADPLGDPEEIYNCRCRMNLQLKGIDHSQDGDAYKEFMSKNFPETWETMQKNESIQKSLDTFDVKRAEAEAKKPAEAVIPAPEKVVLTDSEEKSILPSKDTSETKEDTNMTQATTGKFVYQRSEGIKEWSKAEEKRSEETSQMIDKYHRAGGEWDEYYEENFVEEIETITYYDEWRGREHEISISKLNFTYVHSWDENDNHVKRGKAVTGSTFYSVAEDGDSIDDSVLGYKTLADARHAVELYMDREKKHNAYWANKEK